MKIYWLRKDIETHEYVLGELKAWSAGVASVAEENGRYLLATKRERLMRLINDRALMDGQR